MFVLVYFLCSSGSLLAGYWYLFKLWKEGVLPRKTEQCSHAGIKAGPLDLEMSAITMRPPRLTQFFSLTVINERETFAVIWPMVWGTRSLESSAETREYHLHPSTCRWHFPPFQWNDFQLSLLFIYTVQTLFMVTHSISFHSRYSSYYNKEEKSKEVECSHTKMVWYVFYRD